tara:strand:- start:7373 stop:7939 length:567 start_codon:yes stop_codon:yes gene_type:complete
MKWIKSLFICALLIVPSINVSWADNESYEKGMSLYNRGDWIGAISYFEKAAEEGVAEAQRRLGYILWKGGSDLTQAERWLRSAATANDSEGIIFYKSFLFEYSATELGRSEPVRNWLHQRADQEASSKFILAQTYEADDASTAVALYEELLTDRYVDAVRRLIRVYRYGELGQAVDLDRVEQLQGLLK